MNLRIKTFLIILIILIFISILLSSCSLLRGTIPSLPNKEVSPVHNLTKKIYYDTIQAALDDAASDNIIEVSDGTYDESITFPSNKKVILRSVNGASSTTIRGNKGSNTVVLSGSLTGTTLKGFTITHNSGDGGRGIYNKYFNAGLGYLSINECIISGNSASDGGGIMNDGSLTITGSTISGNSASSNGGGIWNWNDGSLTITGSTISGNSASSNGGGIMNYGTLTITKSTISDNSATTYNGGGIWNWYLLTITESTISGNSSSWDGGGIYYIYDIYNYDGSLTITGNTICGNYKDGDSPSLDQQIMDSSSGSLYETYKDTNHISAYCGELSGPVHNLTKDTYYNTIQAAVNAASSGDTIIVGDGTYTENVDVNKEHLTIKSENGADSTIVQAANSSDDVFYLTANYVNIIGFTVKGATETSCTGILLRGNDSDNVEYCKILNNNVLNNDSGISLNHSFSNCILSNKIESNNNYGLVLSSSSSNDISNNDITNNKHYGIGLWFLSSNNTINNNKVSNNPYGFLLDSSSNNTITNNTFVNNGLIVHFPFIACHNIVENNTVNGKPLVYLEDASDFIITDAGQVILVRCNNITVKNLDLSNATIGIELFKTTNSNIISNNTNLNTLLGILLDRSSNNNISNNNVSLNWGGIGLWPYATNNNINNNTIVDNEEGIQSRSSDNNKIYTNNFVGNNKSVWSKNSTNVWYSPEEITYTYNDTICTNYLGNYWDNYTGNDANNDGIGDTPYIIDSDQDSYPLISPFENYAPTENTPPTIEITDGPSGTIDYNDVTFTWSGNDPDGEVTGYYFGLDDPSPGTWTNETSHTFNDLSKGNHTFYVLAVDNEGTTSSVVSRSFAIELTPAPPLNCAIELEKCSSESYLEPGMPLCWPVSFIGIGASFNINVRSSTGNIKRVRFLSDESQNGVVDEGFTWTSWYDWDISSGDWNHSSKTMTWAFAIGGEKEVWAEIEDSVGRTKRCAENIAVPKSLPDRISLDDVEISTIISYLTQYMTTHEPWPVFLKASLPDLNISANILLIASKDPVTEYKLVRIKTNHVTDPRDLKLYSILPSTTVGCVENYVQSMLSDWYINFGQELAKDILIKIGSIIAGTATGLNIPSAVVSFTASLIRCVEEGYAEPLEEWNAGEDYLVYLPIDLPEGLDLTIKPKRGICDCAWATSPWIFCKDCPGQVQGMWKGRISDVTSEISIDIEETENWWAKIFKIFSSAELRVYNSQGQVSGLVNGDIRQNIPNSMYDEENEAVGVFFPNDSYISEIVGIREGNYGLQVVSVEDEECTTFTATDIPTAPGTVHRYSFDWDALSQGGEGVTVQMDFDGDDTPELNITTDSDFTFVPVTINIEPDTLNLNSKIKWFTTYIDFSGVYDVADIDVDTVKLCYEGNSVSAEWGDIQDGTLMVKFKGKEVQDLFPGPVDAATVAVTGELQDGTPFGGNVTIRVIEKP